VSQSLLTRKRLANFLGITMRTVDNLLTDKQLPDPDYLITARGIKLWHQETITEYLAANHKYKAKQKYTIQR
jgi:predicted DNA-binding transcriptional regulator AlpA